MVTWRGVRPVLLTLMIIASVIIIGAVLLLDIAPLRYISALRDRVAQPDPSPSATPAATPVPQEVIAALIPHYPPQVIAVPPESLFAQRATGVVLTTQPRVAGSFAGLGNCLMNDGTRQSILPDCVVGDEVVAQAGH